jgi:hypothetical protein
MWRFVSSSDMHRVRTVSVVRARRSALLALALAVANREATAQPVQPTPSIAVARRSTPHPAAPSVAVHTGVVRDESPAWGLDAPPAAGGQRGSEPAFSGVSPWYAPPLSALVPGLGQGLLRQQRGIVYIAAEGYLILRAIGAQRDARRERDAYREIARTVARSSFGAERPDGAWEYYERLQHVLESGAFNLTPGAALTPESDPATFNGAMWRLARETFWRDPDVAPAPTSPEYQRALEFYQRRAAGETFRWSWRDAQLEQDLYRQTIDRSNDASRQARQMVGLLLANHALSLVDAYVSVRLRVFGHTDGASRRVGVAGQVPIPSPFR